MNIPIKAKSCSSNAAPYPTLQFIVRVKSIPLLLLFIVRVKGVPPLLQFLNQLLDWVTHAHFNGISSYYVYTCMILILIGTSH